MQKKFRSLVDAHRDRIYTFAYYSLGNREEAEDVAQEVLVKLWKNCHKIEEKSMSYWINRVTRNACIDMVRRRSAYRARVVANSDSDVVITAPSTGPSPESATYSSELNTKIQEALATVSEPYRSIVVLREIQEFSYEEICEALELPLNTIKSYLHRGRRMLRERLSQTLHHDQI